MLPRFLSNSCDLSTCPTACCNSANICAPTPEECVLLENGKACYASSNCASGCCSDKICQGGSSCKGKELGMLSFFAVFILSSIIILIIGLYFHARRKRRLSQSHQVRRFRAPRIRQIIAEGQIIEDKKPPILTIGVTETNPESEMADSKTELNVPYIKHLDPAKLSEDSVDTVIWRSRANSRLMTYNSQRKASTNHPATGPQELNGYDPYLEEKSSPMRKPLDEAKEVPLEEVTISNQLANQILGGFELDEE